VVCSMRHGQTEEADMRRGYRTIVIAMVLWTGVGLVPDLAAEESDTRTFRVDNDTIDVGRVVAGTPVTVTYVFINDGATDISILRASPS